jgi:hypothetical protein
MKPRIGLLMIIGLLAGLHHAAAQDIFVPVATNSVGNGPWALTAADVNGDGKVDLITANLGNQTLSVLTNNGSGGFVIASTINLARQPNSVTAADVNGDGKVDLICTLVSNSGSLAVFTNNGSGGFVLASSPVVGNIPDSVTTADVNGDGKVDLICANQNDYTLSVLTNDGRGNFVLSSSPNLGSGNDPSAVVAADVNGDGKVDLICSNYRGNSLSVLTNDGSGNFVISATYPMTTGSNPHSVVAADINGDGKWALITANAGAGVPPTFGNNTLSVLTNNGSGGFAFASSLVVGNGPWVVTAADINGDGKVDLISGNQDHSITVLTNNGTGGFVVASTIIVGSTQPTPLSVVTADVNGDGRLDLVYGNYWSNSITVLTNTLTFLPRLAVKVLSNNVVVSWPSQWTGWAGWTLQQNTNLNTANWTGFSGIIGDDGTIKTVTNSPPTGNLFFRLLHP